MRSTNAKLYNTNTNWKQNHKIRDTNAKLYNTNTNWKQNHKIRNTTTKLYNTNTNVGFVSVMRILWFCFEFVFVLWVLSLFCFYRPPYVCDVCKAQSQSLCENHLV